MRAWIETAIRSCKTENERVALRVRAWIETFPNLCTGAKFIVALRVRAWIETNDFCVKKNRVTSPSA